MCVAGSYTAVVDNDIHVAQELGVGLQTGDGGSGRASACKTIQSGKFVPEHLRSLMEEASYNCSAGDEEYRLGDLLNRYQDVFSTHDGDVGKTTLVEHHIPLVE